MNYPHPMDDQTGFEATDEEMGLAMPKHTPGPWVASGYDIHGGRSHIAEVLRRYQTRSALDPDDEGAANARLIAAAPDMLAVLRRVAKATGEA
jgi:hypothetical protein